MVVIQHPEALVQVLLVVELFIGVGFLFGAWIRLRLGPLLEIKVVFGEVVAHVHNIVRCLRDVA